MQAIVCSLCYGQCRLISPPHSASILPFLRHYYGDGGVVWWGQCIRILTMASKWQAGSVSPACNQLTSSLINGIKGCCEIRIRSITTRRTATVVWAHSRQLDTSWDGSSPGQLAPLSLNTRWQPSAFLPLSPHTY